MSRLKHVRVIAPLTVFLAVLTVLATAGTALAHANVTVGPLVTVSGPSPYGSCTIGGPGTNYKNAEVEPYVAVNPSPSMAGNIIGVWQQDRWNNGGAHGLVAGYSTDGGSSWNEVPLPFSACAGGGGYERASDPWVSFGPDGTAYTVSISFNASNNNNAVEAATSTDGGKTWINHSVIIADNAPNFQFFNDKESVTADPTTPGVAYVVWDRLELPNGNPDANLHTAAFRGPTFFAKTTDGGQTWSSPKIIVKTPSRQQTIGNQIVVDPRPGHHTLYDFFDLITPPFKVTAFKAAFIKSTDGGDTWTKPQIIANEETVGVTDPNTGAAIRTGDIIPEPAIDPATGRLYVVWQDSRFNGHHFDEVASSTSNDGGATWSTPVRVNTEHGKPAFTPMVHVSSDGTVGVTYYDFRNLAPNNTSTLPTDYWFTSSSDNGAHFGNEAHIIAGSFDMLKAPNAGGFFVGDYEGLDTSGKLFQPFFVQTTGDTITPNLTDVFTATVTP